MRTTLAVVAAVLGLLLALAYGGYQLHRLGADQARVAGDLKAAQDANQAQAAALEKIIADRAADAQLVADLAERLDKVDTDKRNKRQAFAEGQAHATPAEKDLLSSKLPAAALQLFPRSAPAADHPSSR